MTDVQSKFTDALSKFTALTGVSMEQAVGGKGGRFNMAQTPVLGWLQEIKEASDVDPSLLTSWMLLRIYLQQWVDSNSVQLGAVIRKEMDAMTTLERATSAWASMEQTAIDALVEAFKDAVCARLGEMIQQRSGLEGQPEDWIDDPRMFPILRASALCAIDSQSARVPGLSLHQFMQGPRAPGESPVMADAVYDFWNINSLLMAIRHCPEQAVMVALIRSPDDARQSFFAIAVRNGDCISVLTDREPRQQRHPLMDKMARRPDRDLDVRSARFWFPYDLISSPVVKCDTGTGLVPINARSAQKWPLADLHPATLAWLAMVFDLIRIRFFKEDRRTVSLAYTGEMIRVPHALVGEHAAIVKTGHYAHVDLPPIKEDVTGDTAKATPNRWMVERYGARVPEVVMDVVGEAERTSAISQVGGNIYEGMHWGKASMNLETLSPSLFGTAEELRADRLFLAQHNRMQLIQRYAVEEYLTTHEKVVSWYKSAIEARKEMLFNACAAGRLVMPMRTRRTGEVYSPMFGCPNQAICDENALYWGSGSLVYSKGTRWVRDGQDAMRPSWHKDSVSIEGPGDTSIFAHILPDSPDGVAFLCGCRPEELPWQLQRYFEWRTGENPIIRKVNPEAWVLQNPWAKLPLGINVAISRQDANARRKALGLPKKAWDAFGRD